VEHGSRHEPETFYKAQHGRLIYSAAKLTLIRHHVAAAVFSACQLQFLDGQHRPP
jgi:hypothetical protein